jgi:RimJ/RimL family protein N-acetyltransferase
MKFTTAYRVRPTDTKKIREALKSNGFTVKRAKLGSNRFYVLVHTDDNRKARALIESLGFELDGIWETPHDFIFQNESMKFLKVEAV